MTQSILTHIRKGEQYPVKSADTAFHRVSPGGGTGASPPGRGWDDLVIKSVLSRPGRVSLVYHHTLPLKVDEGLRILPVREGVRPLPVPTPYGMSTSVHCLCHPRVQAVFMRMASARLMSVSWENMSRNGPTLLPASGAPALLGSARGAPLRSPCIPRYVASGNFAMPSLLAEKLSLRG